MRSDIFYRHFINSFKLISKKKKIKEYEMQTDKRVLGMEAYLCGLLAHQHRYGLVDYSNYWMFCVVWI